MLKSELFGFYCYLRQLALSIDRREDNKDYKLSLFFKNRVKPISILNYYEGLEKQSLNENLIRGNSFLTEKQIHRILHLLRESEIYLSNLYDDNDKILRLRTDLSMLSNEIGVNIPKEKKKSLDKIEHYNQNETLETYSLSILAKDWCLKLGLPS
ncbi:hypothetical protein [uncultured Croceitalea sp.]|uniref:hypothetical protein n=1 Tax=uncultured Croceitalea sp. TaxID=1798908 RepID=UPI003305C156